MVLGGRLGLHVRLGLGLDLGALALGSRRREVGEEEVVGVEEEAQAVEPHETRDVLEARLLKRRVHVVRAGVVPLCRSGELRDLRTGVDERRHELCSRAAIANDSDALAAVVVVVVPARRMPDLALERLVARNGAVFGDRDRTHARDEHV